MTDDLIKNLWDDRERLNWLEKQQRVELHWIPRINAYLMTLNDRYWEGPTIREAIDAAMAAEAGGQPADTQQHV